MMYDEYIDTHVEYIGSIPKTWKLVKNKHLFNKSKVIAGENWNKYDVLSLTKKGVIIKDINRNEGKMPSDFSIYQIIHPGNLLMCLFDIDVTPRCVGYIENNGIVSAAYTELSPADNISMKYYYWWYLMLDLDKRLLHLSKNLRNSLSTEDFMALSVVKPPLEEQKQIAQYLDNHTSKIDEIIVKNKELISLLEDKIVALINQVVTKGLNPNIPMKDSGIEWIGEIPEHWNINKLSYYFKQSKNKNYSGNEKNLLSLSYGKIIRKDINSNEGLLPENFDTYNIVEKNDIVLRLTDLQNDKKSLRTGLVTERGIITSAYVTLRAISSRIKIKYIHYLLHGYDLVKVFYNMGGGVRQNLNYKELSYLPCLEPPYKEQEEIIEYLDKELKKIETLISRIHEENNLLNEYKSSLIYHVVTGKIRVNTED